MARALRRGQPLPVAWSAELASDGLHRSRKFAHHEFVDFRLGARVVNIDSDQFALGIVVEHDTLGNLPALDARLFRQIDVQRVRSYSRASSSLLGRQRNLIRILTKVHKLVPLPKV